jgi:acetyltransferase-like isoleucine patch superfamily enzyme
MPGGMRLLNFLSWLKRRYDEDQSMVWGPERFRSCGEDVRIARNVHIDCPERVILRDHVVINRGTNICAMGGLYVGRYSGFGINCMVWTFNHRIHGAERIPYDSVAELRTVVIRDYVWVGAGAMILPGVEIGEGAVIGMGSVVTKDVPPLAIVQGNPAELAFYRDQETFERCKAEGKFGILGLTKYDEKIVRISVARHKQELVDLGLM